MEGSEFLSVEQPEQADVVVGDERVVEKKRKKKRKKWSYYRRKKASRNRKRLIAEGKIKYVKGVTGSVSGSEPVVADIGQTVKNRIKALKMELRTLLKFKASLKENDIANLLR